MAARFKALGGSSRRMLDTFTGETLSRRQYLNQQRGMSVEAYASTRKEINYSPVAEAGKKYLSRYTYVVEYKRKNGTYDHISITGETKLNNKEVLDRARKWIQNGEAKNEPKYTESKILITSLKISAAYINE